MPLPDNRTIREIVIDRIEAYVHGMTFYDEEKAKLYHLDYDNVTDKELVHHFEMIMWDLPKIKTEYRKNNPNPNRHRR